MKANPQEQIEDYLSDSALDRLVVILSHSEKRRRESGSRKLFISREEAGSDEFS